MIWEHLSSLDHQHPDVPVHCFLQSVKEIAAQAMLVEMQIGFQECVEFTIRIACLSFHTQSVEQGAQGRQSAITIACTTQLCVCSNAVRLQCHDIASIHHCNQSSVCFAYLNLSAYWFSHGCSQIRCSCAVAKLTSVKPIC